MTNPTMIEIDLGKLLHDLRAIHGVLKTVQTIAARQPQSPERVIELQSLAVEKFEGLIRDFEVMEKSSKTSGT